MAESFKPVGREDFPDRLIPEDPEGASTIVWRYMDDWKFIDLIKRQGIFLCRGDKLQDRFEGTYSRQQLSEQGHWFKKIGCDDLILQEKNQQEENRKKYYINSWCRADHDLDLMWKSYTKNCKAVAIQSRASRLVAICDSEKSENCRPINVSTINYCGLKEGDFINYLPTGFNAFINKDYHFQLDKEIRIIHYSTWDHSSSPEGCFLPVDLSLLIERVVLSPGSSSKMLKRLEIYLTMLA